MEKQSGAYSHNFIAIGIAIFCLMLTVAVVLF